MATSTKTLDGAFSLDELQRTLITQENLGFKHLTSLTKRNAPPAANVATFEDDTGVDPNPQLVLIALKAGDDETAIKANQTAQGRKLLFKSQIFISGNDTQVLMFR